MVHGAVCSKCNKFLSNHNTQLNPGVRMHSASPLTLGSVVRSVATGGFDVLVSAYRPFESHPYHAHDEAAFVYVLDGTVSVRTESNEQHCPKASMRLIPAGDRHQTRYGEGTARCLVMGVGKERSSTLRLRSGVLDQPSYHPPNTPATAYAARIHRELTRNDSATPLAVEALMLELLATGTRSFERREPREPLWLRHVRERIHSDFRA